MTSRPLGKEQGGDNAAAPFSEIWVVDFEYRGAPVSTPGRFAW